MLNLSPGQFTCFLSRSTKQFLALSVVAVLLIVLTPVALHSQAVNAGTVAGLVTDSSGGTVAGATITLADKSTSTARTTTSNEAGRYLFANVPPGTYEITANKTGFNLAKVTEVNVVVGTPLNIDFKLELGSMSQTVEVSTTGADLQTTNSTIGTSIVGQTLLMLPNIGRETAALATLQPAVTPNGYTAGVVNDQNTYQLDGGSISDDMAGSNNVYTPSFANTNPVTTGGAATGVIPTPVESIEEFRVNTSNQTADFNGSAGSQVQMVTKRGTNQYHGALYEYYLNNVVGGANSWDNNRLNIPIPQAHRNRFGGAVGGPVTPSFWGGKTYLFVNYEGLRYPFSTTLDKLVPSAALRAGVIQIQAPGGVSAFNLNPFPVTVTDPFTHQTTTYPAGSSGCGTTGALPCDPRGIGINRYVSQIWNSQLPMPNDQLGAASNGTVGDGLNTQGYRSSVGLPVTSNFGVARLDHDFGKKWHFMGSYRYYHFTNETTNQVDSGGVLPGDTPGQYKSQILRPLVPAYYVGGLTTNFTPFLTNDVHYSYTRNFWLWNSALAPPQTFSGLPALPAPLEIGGETSNAFIPYNVDTQDVRERYWDGQDHTIRDDMSLIHGNHLFQFGGMYQRIWDAHERDDNGVSTFTNLTYVSGGSSFSAMNLPSGSAWAPPTCPTGSTTATNCLPNNQLTTWTQLYEEALGIITFPQVIASRSGPNLALNGNANTTVFPPVLSHSIVPTYNVYFSDSWHMKPSFTFSYGLAWTLEMPPYETTGLDTTLVDASGQQVTAATFLRNREQAALNGQVYLPQIGYELVSNTGNKYAYNPFYGGFSPHFAGAWRPSFSDGILGKFFGGGHTVIRGGWSRIYGRLNGVDLVLVPLLGAGSLQPITCPGARMDGTCQGAGNVDPTNAFRIGTDGTTAPLPTPSPTLSQPNFSGFNGSAKAGDTSELDPSFKPSRSDEFSLSVQREVSSKIMLEVGYVGRILRNEYQAINLSSTPFMTTLGGESFANAFTNLYTELCGQAPGGACPKNPVSAITAQPFFEAAFAMPANSPGAFQTASGNWLSTYCQGFTSCTAAVVAHQSSNIKNALVYPTWSGLPMTFGTAAPSPTVYSQNQLNSIFMETSMGWGNYNGAIVSLTARDWHGVTARSNFTWSRSLGTGDTTQATSSTSVPNPFDLHYGYGPQSFDYRFLYNLSLLYQPPYFKGQHGLLGHVLGGWSFAPLFTANSGAPLLVRNDTSSCQSAWGEVSCVTTLGTTGENAVLMSPYSAGNSANYGVTSSSSAGCTTVATAGNASKGGTGINLFANPCAVYQQFRYLLPTDTNSGGGGVIRNFPGWDLDMTVTKDITFRERFGMMLIVQSTNVLNHVVMTAPNLALGSPTTFGVITASTVNPRQMEFGLRFHF